ncbi:uncharacterized protein TNCV_5066351 [Trichonephila clavipes]|nr:uncharacterized protein TNCV_5066351 [Trichonephila clavipes]
MFDSSSFVNTTPIAHADTSRDVLPRGGTSQSLVREHTQVCLQRIPSHVRVPGNEIADELACRCCDLPNTSVMTHSEIHSLQKAKMNLTWRKPPVHHWYAAKSPGLSLQCRRSRAFRTDLTRFRIAPRLLVMIFVQVVVFLYMSLISPDHLMDCWGISLEQLLGDQDLVCDIVMRKGQMDLE